MSFLKAIEEGKLAKKDKDLQEPKEIIAKKKESSKDELFEQQYDNDPFEYTKQDLEANEKKVHAIYQAKIKELEDETKKLSRRLESQEGSYNSQIEVMQHDFDEALERIKDMTDLSLELEGKLNRSISPEQMADLRSSWNTEHFKELATKDKEINHIRIEKDSIEAGNIHLQELLNTYEKQRPISNKSPSEYVELLKNDQTKTELIYTLHDRIFKVKHKGKNKNYNRKYAIETFRCIMEWRNLQKE